MNLPDTDAEPWNTPDDAPDRYEEMDSDACADDCPCCCGPLVALGQLGNLSWFRCRACGMDCNRPAPVVATTADATDEERPF